MYIYLRFKTPEIASEFKKALDNALDGYAATPSKETRAGSQAPASSKSKEVSKYIVQRTLRIVKTMLDEIILGH